MEPTLDVGQRVLVNRFVYHFKDPKIGDVVVFHPPAGADNGTECGVPGGVPKAGEACPTPTPERSDQNFIKRIVAGPGDTLSVRNGHPVVNGVEQTDEPFINPCGGGEACNIPRTITIPPDHYFMMGDNRGASDDSRFWGPVPRDWIIGKAFATYWPPNRIGGLLSRARPIAAGWHAAARLFAFDRGLQSASSPAPTRPVAAAWRGRWSPPRCCSTTSASRTPSAARSAGLDDSKQMTEERRRSSIRACSGRPSGSA